MNTEELFQRHDPDMYTGIVIDVFTSFMGSKDCRSLDTEKKMAVIDLYNELYRFFNDECSRQEREMAELQRKTA